MSVVSPGTLSFRRIGDMQFIVPRNSYSVYGLKKLLELEGVINWCRTVFRRDAKALDLQIDKAYKASLVEVTVQGCEVEIGKEFVYTAFSEGLGVLPHVAGPVLSAGVAKLPPAKVLILTASQQFGFRIWVVERIACGLPTLSLQTELILPVGVTYLVMHDAR